MRENNPERQESDKENNKDATAEKEMLKKETRLGETTLRGNKSQFWLQVLLSVDLNVQFST